MITFKPILNDLWRLLVSPLLWAAHFIASYATVALWCSKVATRTDISGNAYAIVLIYALIAWIGIAIVGWRGYRQYQTETIQTAGLLRENIDAASRQRRFFGFTTLLLSGLSGLAVLYTLMVPLLVEGCH